MKEWKQARIWDIEQEREREIKIERPSKERLEIGVNRRKKEYEKE